MRKKQILVAATNSFTIFGYKATTIEQISKIANVGKGTIYTYFKDKEELLVEIISSIIKQLQKEAEAVIKQDDSFTTNFHRVAYKMMEIRKKHQLITQLRQEVNNMGTSIVQIEINRLEQAIMVFARTKIEEAIEQCQIKPCDPELTAFILLKMYVALIFDWEQQHEPLPEEKIEQLVELYFLQGLAVVENS